MVERLLPPDLGIENRNGTPVPASRRFGDVYFSAHDGPAESRLVFIEGNRLAERMAGRRHFTIAETGFGTGLNLLATLDLLDGLGDSAPRLTYIATEIAPLSAAEARKALGTAAGTAAGGAAPAPGPATTRTAGNGGLPHMDELLASLPPRWPGRHRRLLAGGRVALDLLYGDSATRLAACAFEADAWFLDGFAPARNPGMWTEELLRLVAGRSAPGATLASFTAAGAVRHGLERAGFEIERHPGHGTKRHRITGRLRHGAFRTQGEGGDGHARAGAPVRAGETAAGRAAGPAAGRLVVLGAGIAGASVAHALRRQGREALVLAAGTGPADGASGGIAAVQTPRLTAGDGPEGRLSLAAWGYARALAGAAGATTANGSIIYAAGGKQTRRQAKILAQNWPGDLVREVDAGEAEAASGVALGLGGCLYPHGGAIDPQRFVEFLLEGSEVRAGVRVREVRRAGDGFELVHDDGTIDAGIVVLAAGAGLPLVSQPWLACDALQVTAGQASHLPAGSVGEGGATVPGVAMSFGGYMAPAADGRVALGAGFDAHDPAGPSPGVTVEAHRHNLSLLPEAVRAALPAAEAIPDGRAGLRLAAPDRQPLAGRLDDGVYALAGLGARGLTTAPLLGEWVASLILGLPSPLDSAMEAVVDIGRLARQ